MRNKTLYLATLAIALSGCATDWKKTCTILRGNIMTAQSRVLWQWMMGIQTHLI